MSALNKSARGGRLRLSWIAGILVFLFLATGAGYAVYRYRREQNTDRLLVKAKSAEADQHWSDASNAYRHYLNRRPDDAPALQAYSHALLEQVEDNPGLITHAVRALENLLRLEPNNLEALAKLTGLYLALREHSLAENLARTWMVQAPESIDTVLALAAAQRGLGRFNEAIDTLKRAIERQPDNPEPYPALVALYAVSLKDLDEARTWINRALEVAPDDAGIRMASFAFHHQLGEFQEAEAHLRRALEIDPERLDALLAGATFWTSRKQLDEARSLLDKAASIAPGNKRVLFARSAWSMARQDPEDLVAVADALLADSQSDDFDLIARAAELLIAARRFDRADDCIEKLTQAVGLSDEMNTWLEAIRGGRAFLSGAIDQALPHLEYVVRRRPTDTSFLEMLAAALSKTNSPEAAINAYRQLLASDPEDANARLAMARLEMQQGRPAVARVQLSQLTNLTADQEYESNLLAAAVDLQLVISDKASADRFDAVLNRLAEVASAPPPNPGCARLLAAALGLADFPDRLLPVVQARAKDPGTGQTIQTAYGQHLLELGDTGGARRTAEELISVAPGAPEGHALLIQSLLVTEGFAPALAYLEGVNCDSEMKGLLYLAAGDQLTKQARTKEALDTYRKAGELRPRDADCRRRVLGLTDDTTVAHKMAQELRDLEGEEGVGWRFEKAGFLLKHGQLSGDREQAVTLLRECVASRPEWMAARIQLASALEATGDLARAVDEYQTVISRNGSSAVDEIGLRLVLLLNRLGRWSESDAVLNRLAAIESDSPEVLRLQTAQHFRGHNLDAAAASAEQLLTQSDDPDWAAVTADLNLRAGKVKQAESIAREWLKRHPEARALNWALIRILLAQDRLPEAESLARSRITNGSSGQDLWLLAQIVIRDGRVPEALELVEKAVAASPQDEELLTAVADFWGARGDVTRQLQFARRAIVARGEEPSDSLAWADVLSRFGGRAGRDEASDIVRRRLSTSPEDARAWFLSAQLEVQRETPDLALAERSVRTALEKNDRSPGAHHLLALIQIRKSEFAVAWETILRGLATFPEDTDLLLLSAELAGFQGEFDRMIPPLRLILEQRPRDAGAIRLMADAYINLQQIDRGIEYIERVGRGEYSPNEALSLSRLYEAKGDREKSLEYCRQARSASNDSGPVFQTCLGLYARLDMWRELSEEMTERGTRFPDDVESKLVAGHLLGTQVRNEDFQNAGISQLEEIINNHPNQAADAAFRLGQCHYHHGRREEAESAFLRAYRLAPRSPGPVNALAWIYGEESGRPEDGLVLIRQYQDQGGVETAEMLDTHGTLLLRTGDAQGAQKKFSRCVLVSGQTSTLTMATYHLGLTLQTLGRNEDGLVKLQDALRLDGRLGGLSEDHKADIDGRLKTNQSATNGTR